MNLSNPETIKSNSKSKKENPISVMFQKVWAWTGMLALMAPGSTTKSNKHAKNIGVLIFIILVSYFGICGLYTNIQWLLGIKIEGEWFYYTGISVLVFMAIDFFDIEKKVREVALEKKIMCLYKSSMLERVIGRSKLYNVFALLMHIITLFWILLGIFFYDSALFIAFASVSLALSLIANKAFKTTAPVRRMFMIESLFSVAIILFILLNYFLNFNL